MSHLREEYGFLKKILVWFGKNSVIVLTMGKVGTLTICNSLDKIGMKHVHPHSLRYTRPGIHFLKNVKLDILKEIFYFYKTITKRIKVFIWLYFSRQVIIITGVRDPFSRSISAFFEQSHYLNLDPNQMNYNDMYNAFEKHYDLEGGLHWFDNEIKKVFGVDVYSTPFDKSLGYQIIEKGKYKIFIYRIDFLNCLEEELKNFVGDSSFRIENANETTNSLNYKKLKSQKKFSKSEYKVVESSIYMNHYYTKNEILEFKEKWISKNEF